MIISGLTLKLMMLCLHSGIISSCTICENKKETSSYFNWPFKMEKKLPLEIAVICLHFKNIYMHYQHSSLIKKIYTVTYIVLEFDIKICQKVILSFCINQFLLFLSFPYIFWFSILVFIFHNQRYILSPAWNLFLYVVDCQNPVLTLIRIPGIRPDIVIVITTSIVFQCCFCQSDTILLEFTHNLSTIFYIKLAVEQNEHRCHE